VRRELMRTVRGEEDLDGALSWVIEFVKRGLAAGPVQIALGRPRRTLDQNAKLWPMLTDISKQVEWYGHWLTPEEWKHVLTAALHQEQKVVPGINGGFVVLGLSTSRMNKREFSDLIELISAFGAEHGVEWSEPAEKVLGDYREAA